MSEKLEDVSGIIDEIPDVGDTQPIPPLKPKKVKLTEQEKELRFREEMKKLDAKAKAKKEQKKTKAQERANFYDRHPNLKWLKYVSKVGFIALIGGSIYIIGKTGMDLYDDYTNTVKWTKVTGPTLADTDPAILYSSDEDKEIKLKVAELIAEIWDKDKKNFTDKVSPEKIDELTKLYNEAKEPKEYLKAPYKEITDFWNVKTSIDNLFVKQDGQTFKNDSKIDKVSEIIAVAFDTIKPYLAESTSHSLANYYSDLLNKIADDFTAYRNLLAKFDKEFDISESNKRMIIKTNLGTKDLDALKNQFNQLAYQYELVDKFINPILKSSDKVAKANSRNQTEFANYTKDINSRDEFKLYINDYKSTMNTLKNSVVHYESFEGKTLSDVQEWASEKGIYLEINYEYSSRPANTVLTQYPSATTYNEIIKGSYMSVTVAQEQATTSTSTSTSSDGFDFSDPFTTTNGD